VRDAASFVSSISQLTNQHAKMSDNIIVKAVAGTCVTFSFILAGRIHVTSVAESNSQLQEMRSHSPT
jgi:hypothetical protein